MPFLNIWRRRALWNALSAIAAFGVAGHALADGVDLKHMAIPTTSNWSGFYAGFSIGAGGYADQYVNLYSDSTVPTNLGDATALSRGTIGAIANGKFGVWGGQIGYNRQINRFLIGAEGDFGFSSLRDQRVGQFTNPDGSVPIEGHAQLSMDWVGTLRARAGFLASDQFLVYATGGLALGDVKYKVDVIETGDPLYQASFKDHARSGYVLGAGLEYAFSSSTSVKVEYQYTNFGHLGDDAAVTAIATGVATGEIARIDSIDAEFHTVKFGLNCKLDEVVPPMK